MLQTTQIRAAKPGSNTKRLRDGKGGTKGFGVTIAPSGKKTFYVSYTSPIDGKRRQVAIGDAKVMSLTDARAKAIELRAQVDSGSDPAETKKQAASKMMAARQLGTLGDLMDPYIESLEADG